MLEDGVVNDRDVERWENSDEACDYSPEEESVPPNIDRPLGKVSGAVWLHAEKGTSHIHHFPCQKESEPGQADECCCTGSEDGVASVAVVTVAVRCEVAVPKAEENERESRKAKSRHPQPIYDHVDQDLQGEDSTLQGLRRSLHDIWCSNFKSQAHIRHSYSLQY